MRKTDISNYSEEKTSGSSVSVGTVIGSMLSSLKNLILTVLLIAVVTGIVVGISSMIYVIGIANEPLPFDLDKIKLSLTSFVWVMDEDTGEFQKYQELYSSENRVWVPYKDIPKQMVDAQIAIEDKRFRDHKGVDFKRTGGAILTLATGGADYGGSTITQQLIKNITNDNEVSITRKLREIFRALKLEEENSKDDIIEAYLNIVNYGAGCNGVQAAANLYYNKDIKDCTIAECAAIAGITQNPYAYNPLIYPDNTKKRARHVLFEMLDQGAITMDEYTAAVAELEDLKFIGYVIEDDDDDESDWNWYMDRIFRDVSKALQEELNIDAETAEDMIYNKGLNIYSAMDLKAQEIAEKKVKEWKTPGDPNLNIGYELIDYEGRVLATVGGRAEKDGRLLWDTATQSVLQPGSTIKPLATYTPALDAKKITFSSLIKDQPVTDWSWDNGAPVAGPNNWYLSYYGDITVTRALNISSNAAAVSVLDMVGMENSYDFLTEKLGFRHLNEEVDRTNRAGLSIGGFNGGCTVEEMTAAYMIFGNGGFYYEPYTYFYVTDNEGNVLLDNRDRGRPTQIISTETATIMNRLLHDVVNAGGEALGYRAKIKGWDIIGKTGTTDNSCDNWFLGASPYAVAGIWTGHNTSSRIPTELQGEVHYLWRDIMKEWLKGKSKKSYALGGDVIQHNYVLEDGLLTDFPTSDKVSVGYYSNDNLPKMSTYDPTPPKKPEPSEETPDDSGEDNGDNGEDTGEPDDGGETTEPDDGGGEEPVPDDGGGDEPAPDDGGGEEPAPDDGGGEEPVPDDGGGEEPAPDDGGGETYDEGGEGE